MLRVAQLVSVRAEIVSSASDPDSDTTNDAFLMLSPAKAQCEASQVANLETRMLFLFALSLAGISGADLHDERAQGTHEM